MRGRGGGEKKSTGAVQVDELAECLVNADAGDGFPGKSVERGEANEADSEIGDYSGSGFVSDAQVQEVDKCYLDKVTKKKRPVPFL